MANAHPKSIYLGADAKLTIQDVNKTYTPEGSQCLVRVHYSGINPCDLNFAHMGLHSYVTGFEFAGTVEQVGPGSSSKPGDAVCGLAPITFPKPSSTGTHQDLCIADADVLYAVPPGLSLKDAGSTLLVAHTAADALFNGLGFSFPAAKVGGADPVGRAILIWGGASCVGAAAIQMARAAGFSPIFATASPKNHGVLVRLGATQCFDYRSATVVQDIRSAAEARKVRLTTAFDVVGKGRMAQDGDAQHSTPALTRAALSDDAGPDEIKLVSTNPVPAIPQFKMCVAYRSRGDHDPLGNPQDPEAPARVRQVMNYFLQTAELSIKLPVVKVVKGASAGVEEIKRIASGAASLEKVVIEHPM